MEATFNLIVETCHKGQFGIVSGNVGAPEFKIPDPKCQFVVGIEPRGGGGDEVDGGTKRNRKRCLDLEEKLAKEWNRWALTLRIKLNTDNVIPTNDNPEHPEFVKGISADVILKGKVLNQLHSKKLYGVDQGRMKMTLTGTLECLFTHNPDDMRTAPDEDADDDVDDEDSLESSFTFQFTANLFPKLNEEGSSYEYLASNVELKGGPPSSGTAMVIVAEKWGLSSVSIIVDGTHSDVEKQPPLMQALAINKRMLESGRGADLKIIGKGEVSVPCHSAVLMESPMVAAKLSGRFETDRTIRMKDCSKEEITAFLEVLYYDGTEKALRSPSVTMAIYEMANYFLLVELSKAMEMILLLKPAEWLSAEDGLELHRLGDMFGKGEIRRKAMDALAIRSDQEIEASELFPAVFPSKKLQEHFLASRKQF